MFLHKRRIIGSRGQLHLGPEAGIKATSWEFAGALAVTRDLATRNPALTEDHYYCAQLSPANLGSFRGPNPGTTANEATSPGRVRPN